MTNRVELPAHVALQRLDEDREARLTRPVPYSDDGRNPFGNGHFDCPVTECDVWRSTRASLDGHVAGEHHALDARDVARINGEPPAPKRKKGRRHETLEARAERLKRMSERAKELHASLRAQQAALVAQGDQIQAAKASMARLIHETRKNRRASA